MTDEESERKDFEEAVFAQYFLSMQIHFVPAENQKNTDEFLTRHPSDGTYVEPTLNAAWWAWKARATKAVFVIGKAVSDLEKIVCTKEPDEGVILLSNKGTTHYEPSVNAYIYDHENFSPLGDALIALHRHLRSL